MADEVANDETRASSAGLADLILAVAGGAVQVADPSPAGVLTGALIPPAIKIAMRLDQQARERRVERAARTLEVAAEALDCDLAALEDGAVRTDAMTELTARVLAASASTATAKEKIDALGRVLASAIQDDARLDEALLLAQALADIEAPHVRVLGAIAGTDGYGGEHEWARPGSQSATLRSLRKDAGGSLVLPGVIAVLYRHGLVERTTQDRAPERSVVSAKDPGEEVWLATGLGIACLKMLLPAPPHWATLMGQLERLADRGKNRR